MNDPEQPIIGIEIGDQKRLRPVEPVHDVDTFIEFLVHLERVFGRPRRRRQITIGSTFRL